jgi:putative membrane-bound dehydrogenase-like protein
VLASGTGFVAAQAEDSVAPKAETAASSKPVAAEVALTQFVLPDDLRIELVAAEPDVIDPVAIEIDAGGRLWVVEMSDYPNGPPADGPPLSRIRVLSDADGDGRYTGPVTFADKLLFANGLMLWQDGALVTTDGKLVFLRDTDGDGAVDVREVWFEGFKRDNPQLRANHPTLGLDNHIYIASGLRGGEVIAARPQWKERAKPVSLSVRDFRFDPLTGSYEAVSGVGQFGLCFDNFGNRFVCSNRDPCNHIVLEDRYLARNPYLAVDQVYEEVAPAAEKSRLFPLSRIWTTSNLHANQFTAACGVLIYRGDALPEAYHGNSFTCEPTSNLVHRDVLTPRGATFASRPGRDGVEFLATKDEWFRPVNLTHGPDGALYVVDMYRAVIEHPQFMPTELQRRPDLTDGSDRGRIYRIVPRASRPNSARPPLRLARASGSELADRLDSTNPWECDTAARLLLERQDASVAQALQTLTEQATSAVTRVRALWLLDGLGALSRETVAAALSDPNPRVREQALLLAERRFAADAGFRDRCLALLADPASDGRLVFQAALSVGTFPASEAVAPALADVIAGHPADHWLQAAVAASAVETMPDVLVRLLTRWSDAAAPARLPEESLGWRVNVLGKYAEIVGSDGQAEKLDRLFACLEAVSSANADNAGVVHGKRLSFALLRGAADGLRRSGRRLDRLAAEQEPAVQQAIASVFQAAQAIAADAAQPSDIRVEALRVMAHAPNELAMTVLPALIAEADDQRITLASIESLARQDGPRPAAVLLADFRHRTPQVRSAVLAAITTPDRLRLLLDELDAERISPHDLAPTVLQRFTRLAEAELKPKVEQLLRASQNPDRQEVINRYQSALTLDFDLQQGRNVFAKTCATCHRVGEVGVNVGPDISDTRTQTPEQLLISILDPNRAVDGNLFGYALVDAEGRVHTGLITAETASSITLRQPEGKTRTFLRRDIEELASTGRSLMPDGFEKDITPRQMADLIAYLKNWRYLDGAVPRSVIGGAQASD